MFHWLYLVPAKLTNEFRSLFPKWQILESFKLKEFVDGSFKFYENGAKFSKRLENTVGKGEITH